MWMSIVYNINQINKSIYKITNHIHHTQQARCNGFDWISAANKIIKTMFTGRARLCHILSQQPFKYLHDVKESICKS